MTELRIVARFTVPTVILVALVSLGCNKSPSAADSAGSADLNNDGTVDLNETREFFVGSRISFAHIKPGETEVYFRVRMSTPGRVVEAKLTGPAVEAPATQTLETDESAAVRFVWTVRSFGTYEARAFYFLKSGEKVPLATESVTVQ